MYKSYGRKSSLKNTEKIKKIKRIKEIIYTKKIRLPKKRIRRL